MLSNYVSFTLIEELAEYVLCHLDCFLRAISKQSRSGSTSNCSSTTVCLTLFVVSEELPDRGVVRQLARSLVGPLSFAINLCFNLLV